VVLAVLAVAASGLVPGPAAGQNPVVAERLVLGHWIAPGGDLALMLAQNRTAVLLQGMTRERGKGAYPWFGKADIVHGNWTVVVQDAVGRSRTYGLSSQSEDRLRMIDADTGEIVNLFRSRPMPLSYVHGEWQTPGGDIKLHLNADRPVVLAFGVNQANNRNAEQHVGELCERLGFYALSLRVLDPVKNTPTDKARIYAVISQGPNDLTLMDVKGNLITLHRTV
jgi:hypothetical protein